MDLQGIIIILIFINGIIAIAFEHSLKINKSWIAIFTGSSMWIVLAIGQDPEAMNEAIQEGSQEIFGLIVFLIGAMTIVEMMAHFRFFTWIEAKLLKLKISNRKLFWILGAITFAASAVLDNLTSTLIMIQIGRHLYIRKRNFNVFVINTVIAANAGGAMSPVGDVTTIMMWLEGKFTAWQIVLHGFLPAVAAWAIPQAILTSKIFYEDRDSREHKVIEPLKWNIILLGFTTFGFAIFVNLVHLPPFMGILLGMGVAAIVIDFRMKKGSLKKKANKMVNVIKTIDMATIIFFIGILLAVHALSFHGVLQQIAHVIFGENPALDPGRIMVGHTILGLVSSVLDNVPLTAAVMEMLPDSIHYQYWILLAVTAGTGGSVLIIGSAAGVAAMGQVPELSFKDYLVKGSIPALLGYFAAIGVWWLQNLLF
ncbi:MAG: hypothetical protein HC819_15975 [Cyclobacteriaceae bacterium]|nr:hypothetical protein [Cyclobacteriaceae bacterium]